MYKMKSFCLKCRKDTENINLSVSNKSNGRTIILSKCAICGSKKSRFIKDQEAKGLLSNLGVLMLGDILFETEIHLKFMLNRIKMSEIVNILY